jgi:hypothetical protein
MKWKFKMHFNRDKIEYVPPNIAPEHLEGYLLQYYHKADKYLHHEQGKYHAETLSEHVEKMLEILEREKDNYTEQEYFLLKQLVLFHDIGKAYTEWVREIDGKTVVSYWGHDVISAHIFREYSRYQDMYRQDPVLRDALSQIITHHLDVSFYNPNHLKDIYLDLGEYAKLLHQLNRLDNLGRIDPQRDTVLNRNFLPSPQDILEPDERKSIRANLNINYAKDNLWDHIKDIVYNNSKVFITFVGNPGEGKSFYTEQFRKAIGNSKPIKIINFDSIRAKRGSFEEDYHKAVKLFKEKYKHYVLILDVTNIDGKHIRRNDVYTHVKQASVSIFINLDTKPFKRRRAIRKHIPDETLMVYDGSYKSSVLDHKLRTGKVYHFYLV